VVVIPYGDVWVDGRMVGSAPATVQVRPGAHVVATGAGAPTQRQRVRVAPGARERVVFRP